MDAVADVVNHAIMLGFVISISCARACYRSRACSSPLCPTTGQWLPPVPLHASLAVRVVGDLTDTLVARNIGGVLGVIAILDLPVDHRPSCSQGDNKEMPDRRHRMTWMATTFWIIMLIALLLLRGCCSIPRGTSSMWRALASLVPRSWSGRGTSRMR